MKRLQNRYGVALALVAQCIGVFTLLRLTLLLTSWRNLPHDPWVLLSALGLGFRMDLAMSGCLLSPALLYLIFSKTKSYPSWWKTWPLKAVYGACFYLFFFLNVSEYYFFDEFNSRFNYIAVDYIFTNTEEVLGNIWQSYPVPLVCGLAAIVVWGFYRSIRSSAGRWLQIPFSRVQRVRLAVLWISITAAALATLRIDLLTANPNRILGEISANGFYTLGYALSTNNLVYGQYYVTLDPREAGERLRNRLDGPGVRWAEDPSNPLRREIPGRPGFGRANVVLILVESLGSEFVDRLRPREEKLTPNLERLADEGLLFAHYYATGNRTVRGLEGVLASFPPIPGTSIVKRHPAQPAQTIARVLKSQGYETLFVYGGRGIFDDMRPFALKNGFDRFVEQPDFKNPVFTTIWGVADEEIYKKALGEMDALSAKKTPFFTTILTVSNHKPYTYPAGRIDRKPEEERRENAVKYSDWALGQFFDQAKTRPFFKNTIFAVLGDHGARVYGADFIPIESYEVPWVVLAPGLGLRPRRVERVCGSMDVSPTLLGLLGLPYSSTFFGQDVLAPGAKPGYALMQHDRDVSLLEGDRLALLSTPRFTASFDFDSRAKRFHRRETQDALDQELIRDAVAYYQTGYDLFMSGRYMAGKSLRARGK